MSNRTNSLRLWYLYEKVLDWSRHPKAVFYLAFLSFVDSSVFPISPLFMLIPMSLAHPNRAFFYAGVATLSSIAGGMLGYFLGLLAFEAIVEPFLVWMGYMEGYQMALQSFQQWGYWAIFIGCFSPFIPYKIFTIGAGVMQLDLGYFLLASTLGRALRFFIICAMIRWGGPKMETLLRRRLTRNLIE